MKIDAFCHLLPAAYAERLFAITDSAVARNIQKRVSGVPALVDLDERFRGMDEFGSDYRQIINTAAPPLDDLGPRQRTAELARIANDGMAQLVADHPDRFAGFCAAVALDDVEHHPRAVADVEPVRAVRLAHRVAAGSTLKRAYIPPPKCPGM